jgi:hypothetical protein
MSKNANPKKVLKKGCFLEVSEHNALIFNSYMKNVVMLIFRENNRKSVGVFLCKYIILTND